MSSEPSSSNPQKSSFRENIEFACCQVGGPLTWARKFQLLQARLGYT